MKYLPLLNLNQLRQDFIKDFVLHFSPAENAYEKWIETQKPNYYVLKSQEEVEILEIPFSEYALIEKVMHMVEKFDFYNTVNFLNRLPKGVKRLRSNPYGERNHESYYDYTEKDGNEKLSHKGNLPKAHFRWNYGERYILSAESIEKVITFLKQNSLQQK